MNAIDLILAKIKDYPKRCIFAIDGPSGAGKTTLAAQLSKVIDCNIIHTDDFFLQEGQEMPLLDINLDTIRLEKEVLSKLNAYAPITYNKYNCATGKFIPVAITPKSITIIEGCYSTSPNLSQYYNFFVFIDITRKIQLERIKNRDSNKYERFVSEWIPLEDKYFGRYELRNESKKEPNLLINL